MAQNLLLPELTSMDVYEKSRPSGNYHFGHLQYLPLCNQDHYGYYVKQPGRHFRRL